MGHHKDHFGAITFHLHVSPVVMSWRLGAAESVDISKRKLEIYIFSLDFHSNALI